MDEVVQEVPADDANVPDKDISDDVLDESIVADDAQMQDSDEQSLPTLTYRVENGRIQSMVDGPAAMLQAIDKILKTERFVFPIYDEQYGNDINELIGKDLAYVLSDVERVISEALKADDRVIDVEVVELNQFDKDTISMKINVNTSVGPIVLEKEVSV